MIRALLLALVLVVSCAPGVRAQTTVPGPTVHAAWNPNPEPDIAGYHLIIDNTIYDVGNVTDYIVPLVQPGPHAAVLTATNTSGLTSPMSNPPVLFTVTGQADPCLTLPGGPVSIVVSSYTTPLQGGQEGTVVIHPIGPAPVVQLQVLLGTAVAGEIPVGAPIPSLDLRFVRGIGFGTPRTPGTYNLFVAATDSRGCHAQSTIIRPLVIQ